MKYSASSAEWNTYKPILISLFSLLSDLSKFHFKQIYSLLQTCIEHILGILNFCIKKNQDKHIAIWHFLKPLICSSKTTSVEILGTQTSGAKLCLQISYAFTRPCSLLLGPAFPSACSAGLYVNILSLKMSQCITTSFMARNLISTTT